MSTIGHAVIAAAGFGSRLGRGHPKCLVEFLGRTLLDRQLELLADIPDVRIVVGFQEELVVEHALQLRSDAIIVRNPAYATTTTLDSYAIGARFLDKPCLFMDADIIFDSESFGRFLELASQAGGLPLAAYTDAKTCDAVYCTVADELITGFSRSKTSPYEWANLACLPAAYCERGSGAVYEHLSADLPLPSAHVVSYEIDRAEDLAVALRDHALLSDLSCQEESVHTLTETLARKERARPQAIAPGIAVARP